MGLISAFPSITWHIICLQLCQGCAACRVHAFSGGKSAFCRQFVPHIRGPARSAELKQCKASHHCLPPPQTNRDLIGHGNIPVLGYSLLSFESIFCPHSLRVNEFTLPRLDVTIQIWDELVLLVTHPWAEMSNANIGLLGPPGAERQKSEVGATGHHQSHWHDVQ